MIVEEAKEQVLNYLDALRLKLATAADDRELLEEIQSGVRLRLDCLDDEAED